MDASIVSLVIAVIGAGGLGGLVLALIKARPEASAVIVDSAKGAVLVQSGVIDDLREALAETRKELTELRGEVSGVNKLRGRIVELERELGRERSERKALEEERFRLRDEVQILRGRIEQLERNGTA